MDATKKSNPWLVHVAKFRKENPSLSYKDVLKQAKTTYTKGSAISGGAVKKPRAKKGGSVVGGSVSGGSVVGGSVSGGSVVGGAKEKKPRKTKGGSIVGGSVSGGSVVGGSSKTEKKPRKTRKDKGTKKGGKMFGEDGHGIQKVPVDHVTAELVKQV